MVENDVSESRSPSDRDHWIMELVNAKLEMKQIYLHYWTEFPSLLQILAL